MTLFLHHRTLVVTESSIEWFDVSIVIVFSYPIPNQRNIRIFGRFSIHNLWATFGLLIRTFLRSENTQRHVMQRVPQRPKHNNALRRSNSIQNGNSRPATGNSRPTTGNRQTRQRAVNIAIHDLKSQNHDQRYCHETRFMFISRKVSAGF